MPVANRHLPKKRARRAAVLGLTVTLLLWHAFSVHVHVHAAHAPLNGHQTFEVNTAGSDDHLDHHADYGEQDLTSPGVLKNPSYGKLFAVIQTSRVPPVVWLQPSRTTPAREGNAIQVDTDSSPPPPLRAPPR